MSTPSPAPSAGIRIFNALAGLTTLAIFLQSLSAGMLMAQRGTSAAATWTGVHGGVAWIAIGLALATAVVAIVRLRSSAADLMWAAIALVVLLVAQTGIGQAIGSVRALVAVHVPLAFVIFALTVWLSVRGAMTRRRLASAAA